MHVDPLLKILAAGLVYSLLNDNEACELGVRCDEFSVNIPAIQ